MIKVGMAWPPIFDRENTEEPTADFDLNQWATDARNSRRCVVARPESSQFGLRPFGHRFFLKDLRSAIERSQLGHIAWQLLVGSDHQIAPRSEPFEHTR
jgi:hypothetical protein